MLAPWRHARRAHLMFCRFSTLARLLLSRTGRKRHHQCILRTALHPGLSRRARLAVYHGRTAAVLPAPGVPLPTRRTLSPQHYISCVPSCWLWRSRLFNRGALTVLCLFVRALLRIYSFAARTFSPSKWLPPPVLLPSMRASAAPPALRSGHLSSRAIVAAGAWRRAARSLRQRHRHFAHRLASLLYSGRRAAPTRRAWQILDM